MEVKRMGSPSKSLIAYTFSHFCVDFTCFYILFQGLWKGEDDLAPVAVGFLAYNVIAFGLQPLIGFFCDDRPRLPVGIIGCCMVAAGLLVLSIPWLAVCLAAFGNACFHIGGGIDALRLANGKMARSGIFVSTGALGVAFGTMLGRSGVSADYVPFLLMAASVLLLILFVKTPASTPAPAVFHIASDLPFSILLVFALGSVVIRSFAGGVIPITWRTGAFLLLLPGIASFAGKALGGMIGDRFGAKTVGVSALLLSVPLLILGKDIVLLSVAGILLFNMTMPITLCTVASRFPMNPGLAFGLTTLALLSGNIPAFFIVVQPGAVLPVLISLVVLSAIFTAVSTRNLKGEKTHEKNQQ